MAAEIIAPDGRTVPPLRLTTKMVLDRTISLYGPSGSGKTVIVKSILDLLRAEVDQILVVSPTEPTNNSYKNVVPPQLIHYSMTAPHPKEPRNPRKRLESAAGAQAFMEMIWKRQEMLCQTYNQANDPETLSRLFKRISTAKRQVGEKDLRQADEVREKALARLATRYAKNTNEYDDGAKKIEEGYVKIKCKIYKLRISEDLDRLWKMAEVITPAERKSLQYLELNPRMVLIFDDCAADLKPLFTKPIFKKLFYQNRHNKITVIFTFQDDTDLPTAMRKNSFISIFCSETVCNANFSRAANQYPKTEKETAAAIAGPIYEKTYRKLAYVRENVPVEGQHFYTFEASRGREQMFGSGAVQELCAAVKARGDQTDRDNPYFRRFTDA